MRVESPAATAGLCLSSRNGPQCSAARILASFWGVASALAHYRQYALALNSMTTRITGFRTYDARFPTNETKTGSDAVHHDGNHSAAYIVLETDTGLRGCGLAFTIGSGDNVVVAAIEELIDRTQLIGTSLESITSSMGEFWQRLANDSQLRWLGPQKGVIHLAVAAVVNAVWDLWAKSEGKPLWRLL